MRCITVTIYDKEKNPQQDIFCTQYLTDRLFSLGFRIVNPEFKCTPDRLTSDMEALLEVCEDIEAMDTEQYHPYHRVSKYTKQSLDVNRRGV